MTQGFDDEYAAALRTYLQTRSEKDLAVGNELGRRALHEDISVLMIVEKHTQLFQQLMQDPGFDGAAALAFLLQTLAPLDVATRGFLAGTKRYEEQRARAEYLADRDEFRNAVVNSLHEGFFVAEAGGAVVEVNDAFTKLTGYPADGLPYPWPHPWLVDYEAARLQQSRLAVQNQVQYETPIRHRDGRLVWVAANVNRVHADAADGEVLVGTLRDVTAERAFAARESAVLRLATAVSVAKSMSEVLATTLDECRLALDVHRVVAAVWPSSGAQPTIQVAGEQQSPDWRHLDPALREIFEQARRQLPLTVQPIESPDAPGQSRGIVAVLSGGGGIAFGSSFGRPDGSAVKTACWSPCWSVTSGWRFNTCANSRPLARPRSPCSTRCWRPPNFHPASPFATSRRFRRWKSAATGMTCCGSATIGSASSSATVWDAGCRPPR
jgi:PAS domain S-box-containing protein